MMVSYSLSITSSRQLVLLCVSGIDYKTTTILLDGRRVKLQLWYVAHLVAQTCTRTHLMELGRRWCQL